MDHGEALGRALGETIRTNDPAPLKRYEADCKKLWPVIITLVF